MIAFWPEVLECVVVGMIAGAFFVLVVSLHAMLNRPSKPKPERWTRI